MAIETAIHVQLVNRPGELARVARQLANAGVNIRTIAGITAGGEGVVEFLVDNQAAATQALRQGGIPFSEVRVVVSPIPQQYINQPGALARLAEALAEAGINVDSFYPAPGPGGQVQAVVGCSDPEKAAPLLTTWGA
jgi:hypothetical protein